MDLLVRLEYVTPIFKLARAFGKGQPHLLISCQSLWDYFDSILLPCDGIDKLIRPKTLGHLSNSGPLPYVIFNPISSFGRAFRRLSRRTIFLFLMYGIVEDLLYSPSVYTPLTFGPFLPKKRKYKKSVLLKVKTFLACRSKTLPSLPNTLVYPPCKVCQSKIRSPLTPVLKVFRSKIRPLLIPVLKVPWCFNPIGSLYQLKIRSQLFPRAGVG